MRGGAPAGAASAAALAAALAATAALAAAAGAVLPPAGSLLALLVLAPLLEEAVFRAGLQEALQRRWPAAPRAAIGATALAFAAAHAAVRADPAAAAVALPAVAIGIVYRRTGRLRDCVALHAALNAAWLAWRMAGGPPFGLR